MLDRGIVNLLVPDMKRDFQLSDTQVSLLLGLAFALFYAVLGLPIARLVDSKSRRLIMGIGIATWSLMTAFCGLAQNFWHLFIARMGVGVGEACNGPSTYSMMSDLFPRERLTRAASALQIGFVLGTGLALYHWRAWYLNSCRAGRRCQFRHWPAPSRWQFVFLIVGIPGLLIAALMGTVQEPKRRGLIQCPGKSGKDQTACPCRDVVKFLGENWKFYGPMYLGLAVNGLTLGSQAWVPDLFSTHLRHEDDRTSPTR